MTKPLDDTLEALQNIQDAINTIKTKKTITTDVHILKDYDKIIEYLEKGSASLLDAVVIFLKHERSQ